MSLVYSCHKDAVFKTVTIPSTHRDIGECLSAQHAREKLERRQCFLKLLSNVRFLARQALPLRGDGDESDSNYIQLLKLRGEDDPRIFQWLKKKTDKYTSADMQNEMIRVMAFQVLREIAERLHSTKFYTIMADETTDAANHEQVVICIRWVNDDFEVHEEFIGLYKVDSIDAVTLVKVIKDVLQRLNLSLNKMKGTKVQTLGVRAVAGVCMDHAYTSNWRVYTLVVHGWCMAGCLGHKNNGHGCNY